MSAVNVYTELNQILESLRDGEVSTKEAQTALLELKDKNPEVDFTVPSETELVDLFNVNNDYESSYTSSY